MAWVDSVIVMALNMLGVVRQVLRLEKVLTVYNSDGLMVRSPEAQARRLSIATRSTSTGDTSITDAPLLETVQSLILLIALSMWSEWNPSASDALSLRSTLERLVHDPELDVFSSRDADPWKQWLRRESVKRTKLMVYCFFNLLTIVFDVPPICLFADVDMDLPCTNQEWSAASLEAWQEARTTWRPEPKFQDALTQIFVEDESSPQPPPTWSSLGGYVLIHAIIQHIWLLQQVARLPPGRTYRLQREQVTSIEAALRRWRDGWERDVEASINPVNPHGPLSFNSTALLRMAYIRINIDSGSVRSLATWDPLRVAVSLAESPPIVRSEKLTRAALHCAHALSIPVKLGINFVAHTQVFYWSNQHALCSLECALLLSKWLQAVTVPRPDPALSKQEQRLLEFVVQMVGETAYAAPLDQLVENNKRLSTIVVRVWAKLFRSDSIWEMVDLIGRSLNAYADLLEKQAA